MVYILLTMKQPMSDNLSKKYSFSTKCTIIKQPLLGKILKSTNVQNQWEFWVSLFSVLDTSGESKVNILVL